MQTRRPAASASCSPHFSRWPDPSHDGYILGVTDSDVLKLLQDTGALLSGHFILRSGRHSRQFFQCARLLQHPAHAERLCAALAERVRSWRPAAVISPALGGLFVGHEIARALGTRHIFGEKENDGLVLRRGFEILPDEPFLVAEDVVTEGGRVRQTIDLVRQHGGRVAGVATLVFRGGTLPDLGCPFEALLRLPVETFSADALPPDLQNVPAVKPGSK